jgi:glycosyltransferase involved in cell wall biosynthesis
METYAKISKKPMVTVLMPVYNSEHYLSDSIESILKQTYNDFEFIIIDDGSTDHTPNILSEYASQDNRIVLSHNRKNLGITKSLNKGLDLARGKYLARQDADDISDNRRFQKQLNYLQNHPEVGLLGTACHIIGEDGKYICTNYPQTTDTAIRWRMLFRNTFIHTSIMVRRKLLTQKRLFYSEELKYNEDMGLWVQMLKHTQSANLKEPLVSLRKHEKSISAKHLKAQELIATKISFRQLSTLLPERVLSVNEVGILREWHKDFPRKLGKEEVHLFHTYVNIFNKFSEDSSFNSITINYIRCYLLLRIMRVTPLKIFRSLKLMHCILKPVMGVNFPFFLAGFIKCLILFFHKIVRQEGIVSE